MKSHAKQEHQRTRLLEFLTFFYIGGTERQVMNLTTGVDRGRFDVQMGCLGKEGPFLEEALSHDIPVKEYKIHSLSNWESVRQRMQFARDLRDDAIDIVHSYGFYSNMFAIPAARLAGVPVIIAAIRDCGETLTAAQNHAHRVCCRLADCILVNADGVRNWLIGSGYPAEKIQVIRNGIIPEGQAIRPPTGKLRQEFGLSPDTPVVAVLSRLNAMKGLEYFLEAATVLSRNFPRVRFMIIGGNDQKNDTHYEADIKAYADSLGLSQRVIFTGFRTDVQDLLPEIDISVLPSLSEGLSNSLLESMAAGVPVIATNVGGTPEALEDGVSGILVPPRDSDALVRAISHLIENREYARWMGDAGRRRVETVFSIETMVRQTESLYLSLLSEKAFQTGHRQVATS